MPSTPWYGFHDNVANLARYLADNGTSADNLADYIEKPWKWEDEWQEYLATPDAVEAK
jgi:hypothetical protein